MDNKLLTGIIINIFIIVFVLSIFLGPTMNLESTLINNDDSAKNITLIKEDTSGYVFVNNGSDPYYNFYVKGVLLNLPSNIDGYDLKTIYYGEDGKNIHEYKGNIQRVASDSSKSEQSILGAWQTQDPQNVSKVEIIIINPTGETIFNQTLKYDMDKFDYSRLNHK